MSGGDPGALRSVHEGMSDVATDIDGVVTDVRAAYGACEDETGKARVDAALERFTAAYGGELMACGLSTETLGKAASENAELLDQVTGG